jgi:meso-butanediol dehydrogenase/(S,S)-butanediol dehydrogenase/diacetyl reductase
MIDLKDKVSLITGGATGIGKGICSVLANQGAHIVICDIDTSGAEFLASELSTPKRHAIAINTDVTSKTSVEKMINQVIKTFGQIDIAVNNAGVINNNWDLNLAVNLRGVVNISNAVAPYMKKRKYGKIINVTSTAARQGKAGSAAYDASKAATLSFTQSTALLLAHYNINVNAICPGNVFTSMSSSRVHEKAASKGITNKEYFENMAKTNIPLKRAQTPEDIGNLIAFMASEDSCNITGQTINIDGGQRLD